MTLAGPGPGKAQPTSQPAECVSVSKLRHGPHGGHGVTCSQHAALAHHAD